MHPRTCLEHVRMPGEAHDVTKISAVRFLHRDFLIYKSKKRLNHGSKKNSNIILRKSQISILGKIKYQ